MTEPREEWRLDTRRLGRRVLVFDRVDSTNRVAADLAGDARNDGLAILADEQTAGRGQHGRSWLANPGSGVLLSILLFPPSSWSPALLTAWVAVSVCATVRKVTGLQSRIKWPNDVLVRGRKVCGILMEKSRGTVVGIGLNVRQTTEDFSQVGLPEAASLGQFAPAVPDTRQVARLLLESLDEEYASLLAGDLATLEASWKLHLGLQGKQVLAECAGGTYRGLLRAIAFDGIELEQAGEMVLRLEPERILHLTALPGESKGRE